MEYLEFLPVGMAVAALALRAYLSLQQKRMTSDDGQATRARRVPQAVLSRGLLQYHRGLARAQ